jgi:hypothetical protein
MEGQRGGWATPRGGGGWRAATLSFFFFLFDFFLKNKFIYLFLINLYFFIKMDTCHHLIGNTWRWRVGLTDSVKMVDEKST